MCKTTKNTNTSVSDFSREQLESIRQKLLFYAAIEYERYKKRCKTQ